MARVAVLLAALAVAPALPEGCRQALGKKAEPAPTAAPVVVVPPASATTPPIWAPPDTSPPPDAGSPPNPDLAKARALAQSGDNKKLKALLEKKVRAGKATREEAFLLVGACGALKDKACVDAAKAKYPEVDSL